MKKIFLILLSVVAVNVFAGNGEEPNCDMVLYSFNNFTTPIEIWGQDYQSCEYFEWNLTFPSHWEYVDFDYTVDFNPTGAMDDIRVYVEDENGIEREILNYPYQPITGRVTIPLYSHIGRVVYRSYYGNTGGIYNGFKLYYREGHVNNSNHVFLSDVGIGTYPKETLHVNGAIRGGGINGEVTLKGDNGSVTIGATDAQTMTFNTNKSKFVFNKPIYNKSGVYDSWNNTNLQFNTNGTNRMIILNNGNVGIGTLTPATELHIASGTLKIGTSRLEENQYNVLQFGDEDFVQIGEWEQDDYLSFKARGYNFIYGDVGIGVSDPQYRLDVAGTVHSYSIITDGTIRASEIIVTTTGADFVFAEDYQLRSLSEVKAFIEENKHLPEIKSAQEMQEEGVSISELQTQLLQKIEELTLYLIQQEQTIQELRQEVEQLKK